MNEAVFQELMTRSRRHDLSDVEFCELSGLPGPETVNVLISLRLLSGIAMVHSMAKMEGKKRPSLFKFLRGTLIIWFKFRKEEKRHLLRVSGE